MPEPEQCNFWAQDCPEGQKCTWVFNQSNGYEGIEICVEAGDGAIGDPCTMQPGQDSYGATDTCGADGHCFPIDAT